MSTATEVREMSVPIAGRPALPRALQAARRGALEQRWSAGGVAALADDEALALLCGVDATVGEDLLAAFGSVPEVWGAAEADLARVAGPRVAARIKLAQEVARRVLARPLKQRTVLGSWSLIADHLRTAMVGAPREQFRVLFLDKRNRLIAVHLAVRALGDQGERLNPKKADLETWRQVFAQALRDRGVEAEATPRRARGVTRKAERTPLRKIRERHEAGQGAPAMVRRAAYHDAAKAAFKGDTAPMPWEAQTLERQAKVRSLYLAQAQLLCRSSYPEDRALGSKVETFVKSMPQPDSQRLALARELRAANLTIGREQNSDGRDRGR
jgi:hypothetical protein